MRWRQFFNSWLMKTAREARFFFFFFESFGYEVRQQSFAGSVTVVRAGITALCESWVKKGWLESKKYEAGRWSPTSEGLIEFRKKSPE